MLMRGTTKHTRQQIQDELDRLKAQRQRRRRRDRRQRRHRDHAREPAGGAAARGRDPARAGVPGDRVRAAAARSGWPASRTAKSDPQAIACTRCSAHCNPYPQDDIRYVPTLGREIADGQGGDARATSSASTRDFYGASRRRARRRRRLRPGRDREAGRPSCFGGWKSPKPFARLARHLSGRPAGRTSTIETPDKANAFFIGRRCNLELRDDDPDYPALVLGNYMLGGGFLNSRLATRIRQKEGLCYGVGLAAAAPARSTRTAASGATPSTRRRTRRSSRRPSRKRSRRSLRDGLHRPRRSKAAKAGWLQSQQVTRAQDALARRAPQRPHLLDRTITWDGDFEKRIESLTPAQIRDAMARHLDPERISFVKAGDFAKAAQASAATRSSRQRH